MRNDYDLHPVKHIIHELFPARVSKDGELLGKEFKVFITDVTATIWQEGGKGPEMVSELIWDDLTGTRKDGIFIAADDSVYFITREDNCGCGSRLRSLRPYPGVPRIASK